MRDILDIPHFPEKDINHFPCPSLALKQPDGLLALGGNLSQKTLVNAYENGVFPWFEEGQPIMWWSPSQRAVIETANIHISKNMAKLLSKETYHVSIDTDFLSVIHECARSQPSRPETWITQQMINAYKPLFDAGIAHSIEVWNQNHELVGGLYGVFVKNCFCGESMFSQQKNASKIALITLAKFLQSNDCQHIDCQMPTDHLSSMGAKTLPRKIFIERLSEMKNNMKLNKKWTTKWPH